MGAKVTGMPLITCLTLTPVVGALQRLPMADQFRYFFTSSMVALSGAPLSVAMLIFDGTSTRQVQVFDDGVARATIVKNTIIPEVLFAGPPGTVFGFDSVPGDFFEPDQRIVGLVGGCGPCHRCDQSE